MKTLLILRHAKSSWADARLADHDRPLNKRGKRDAPRMGQLLHDEDLVPDLIVSSTAKRARATAAAVAEAADYDGEVRLDPSLYHGEPEDYYEVLRTLEDDLQRVMVVGHNPGMEALVEALTDQDEHLPTAALAHVTLPIDRWREVDDECRGRLVHLWRPREL